jgi:hypothetical protein
MTKTATLFAMVASVSLSAQTNPAQNPTSNATSNPPVTVTGCVAQVQRDGSMGAKGTGTTSTPETAPVDANSPDQTGRYQLVDATPAGGTDQPTGTPAATAGTPAAKAGETAASGAKATRTTYTLRGQEGELSKHIGHRVQIAGSLMPPIETKLPSQAAKTAEGVRTVQVTSVKMMGTDCSAKGK